MITILQSFNGAELIIAGLALILTLIISLSMHELAHAFVAYKCGDTTPKAMGRLTLNPIAHMDPVGLLFCMVFGFGWAKPVPVNPTNFRNYRKGCALVSVAGVIVNYILATISYLGFILCTKFITEYNNILTFIEVFCFLMYNLNIMLFVFNLLPLYPLDGFNLLNSFTRENNRFTRFVAEKGTILLLVLLVVDEVLSFGFGFSILGFLVDIAALPIKLMWGWIL